MDIITINRCYSWYYDPGHTETVATRLSADLQNWYRTHGKPMMLTEYGAGTVTCLHEVRGCVSVCKRACLCLCVFVYTCAMSCTCMPLWSYL